MLRAALVLAGGVAFASTGAADTLRKFNVGGWEVRAIAFEGTKRLSHCVAGAPYHSGVAVFFVVMREYQWAIAFHSEDFDFEIGKTIKLGLALDNDAPTTVTGHTISRDTVRVDLAPTSELFDKFRRGGSLSLIGSNRSYRFNLTDTSKVLPALVQCVNSALNPTPMQTAQQAMGGRPTAAAMARAKGNRAEAMEIVVNLLSLAGVPGFQIAPAAPGETGAIGDVGWSAGNVSGALMIVENDPDIQVPSDTSPRLIAATAAGCKGAFFSGAIPADDESAGKTARVFAHCKTAKDARTVYFLTTPRRRGGYYVFATVAAGAETPAKKLTQRFVR